MTDQRPISLPDAVTRAAESRPETPYLADSPWIGMDVYTCADLKRYVDYIADRLWAAGIRSGKRVAIVKRDHLDIQAIGCAVMQTGATPALLSAKMSSDDLLSCLQRLDEPVVLFDASSATRFADAKHELARHSSQLLSLEEPHEDWVKGTEERGRHKPVSRSDDALILITHSSGTTGTPKLVGHSTSSLFAHVAPTIPIGQAHKDEGFSAKCLSWTHVRTTSALIAVLELGIPMIAITDPRPEHVKEILLRYRPTAMETHPNLYLRWEELAYDPQRPLASIARFINTFDAVHPRTVRAMLNGSDQPAAFHIQGYGQTETGPLTIRLLSRQNLDDVAGRNVGAPTPGFVDVRIVDETGEPVEPGSPGRIEARTPGLMLGYIGTEMRPKPGSWWGMQDVGRTCPDGTIELLDRVVDQADAHLSLIALEDELLDALPELAEVVLVKPSHGRLAAVVCLRPGESLDRNRWSAVADGLGIQDVAVHEWIWDELPFTGSWKVRRHQLARTVRLRESESGTMVS